MPKQYHGDVLALSNEGAAMQVMKYKQICQDMHHVDILENAKFQHSNSTLSNQHQRDKAQNRSAHVLKGMGSN